MGLGKIFEDIKDALTGNSSDNDADQNTSVDTNADPVYDNEQGILPASQDPYGDPTDQGGGTYAADQQAGVLPASQDPYGDPALDGTDDQNQ
ncbi:MAG: translation initiation factor [Armatimonadetes bacterium]|nr:translation initiation factor [Armatimonadota bacterium]